MAEAMWKGARPLRERRHTVPEGVAIAIHRGMEPYRPNNDDHRLSAHLHRMGRVVQRQCRTSDG